MKHIGNGNSSKRILIDVGSSTVKVYKNGTSSPKLIFSKSIPFKEGFDPDNGLTSENKNAMFDTIYQVKKEHKDHVVKIYATALYRKLSDGAKLNFIDEFYQKTGLLFNIIDHDLENHYLEAALVGESNLEEPILLINVGGGSTELVVLKNKRAIERVNIEIGVGTINTKFVDINSQVSGIPLKKVISFVKDNLPKLKTKVKLGFYTGGELTFMKLADYKLRKNQLFKDTDHPFVIDVKDFKKRNDEIYHNVTLSKLESLLPDNPNWMHGARGCSAIAQAICEKYKLETLIPSDSNLINGVSRKEFRTVTLSGSFRKHLEYILNVRKLLLENNIDVLSPRFTEPKNPGEEFVVFGGEENMSPLQLERHHLHSIANSDALIVCDPDGYVGASALIEIGYANSLGKRIIFTEKPEEFMLNTLPAEIGL